MKDRSAAGPNIGLQRTAPCGLAAEAGSFGVLILAGCILALVEPSAARADCPDMSVDVQAVKALIAAPNVRSLDNTFARTAQADIALVAVYRNRRLTLEPTEAEQRRYIDSLPKTQSELSRVYALAEASGICEDPLVSTVVYGMFDTAAKIVRDQHRGYRRFIELCNLTDGEVGEVAWPAFDRLLEQDTARTVAALRTLPKRTRTRLCDGHDPRFLTDKAAASSCRSGL